MTNNEETTTENYSVTEQIIITRRDNGAVALEFSDDTSVGDALLLLEIAKIDLYASAMGLKSAYDDGDDSDEELEEETTEDI